MLEVFIINHETRKLLANNIVYFRKENGWSQEEFALKIKSGPSYISQIENAKRNVTVDFIDKLVKIFKIETFELFVRRSTINIKRVNQKK